jgi:serine/threonine-protein kinase
VDVTRPCSSCETPIPADAAFCPGCGAASASPILSDTLLGATRTSTGISSSYELAPERLQAALGPNYELGRLLGRGGYAEVFTVRDLRLKRELALKVLRPDLILTDSLIARFRREAEAVAALQNPHIVPVYDVGESDGICWLLMPLVRGETLKSVLAREGRLSVAEARRILLEAADALQTAHEAGVVHRDIKPENLMIDGKTQRVLLMDFGIAKAMDPTLEHAITGTGVVVGTPNYMSPEQAMGSHAIDPRSDQYSLAVVGYQMLSGRVPFEGENVREVIARQLLEEAIPLSRLVPNVPPEVSSTIHQALRKDMRVRFVSMEAFGRSLRGEIVTAADGGVVRRKGKFNIPERRRSWILAAVWLVVLAGGLYGAKRVGLFTPATPDIPRQADSAPARPPERTRRIEAAPARRTTAPPARPVSPAETTLAVAAAPVPVPAPATCEAAYHAQAWAAALLHCTAEADSNSPSAQRTLGLLYAEGKAVERNERLAATHFTFAADVGDSIAALEMARRYELGKGVSIDPVQATRYYNLAANLGVREAYPIIARRYEEGTGTAPNPKQAVIWYEKAANAGDVPSMTKLAAAYAQGRGVKKDERQATGWYGKAAEARDPEAEYQLGMMLLSGKGGFKKDESAGLGWLRRAAAHGHEEAQKELTKRAG